MEYSFFDVLKLLGSLGFFLYGMKLMSESLQRVAGDKMRGILAAMTSNKFKGVLTGFAITALVQSSSATTVMLVSFVNAGLISLSESIGVVMGTNIGTTVTAWLISILGLKVKISTLALPLIGFAIPLLFSKKQKWSDWGSVVVGFAIIFIGLDFLQDAAPDIKNNPQILQFLTEYSNYGFGSVIIFMLISVALTMIIQSSSAVMALTLIMCFNGWVNFEMAAAMVLGQNIGTTITANLAALVANTSAKRTAMAHLLFNVIGVVIVLIIFNPFLQFVDYVIEITGFVSPFPNESNSAEVTAEAIPIALSIFHSIFNLFNTLLLIGFVKQIEKIVTILIPLKETEDDEFKLQHIQTGMLSTSELSIVQAQKEINVYASMVSKMYNRTTQLISSPTENDRPKLIEKIYKSEEVSDSFEVEIASYLTDLTRDQVSTEGAEDITIMLDTISYLESIADSCFQVAQTVERKEKGSIEFISEIESDINSLSSITDRMVVEMAKSFDEDGNKMDYEKINSLYNSLNETRDTLQVKHYKSLRKGKYKVKPGVVYNDICDEISKMGKHIHKISEISHLGPNVN